MSLLVELSTAERRAFSIRIFYHHNSVGMSGCRGAVWAAQSSWYCLVVIIVVCVVDVGGELRTKGFSVASESEVAVAQIHTLLDVNRNGRVDPSEARDWYKSASASQVGAMAMGSCFNVMDGNINGEKDVMSRLVRPGDVVLDVGSNSGWWTVELQELHANSTSTPFESLSVHALEPGKAAFLAASRKLSQYPNVQAHQVALGNKTGVAMFAMYGGGEGESWKAESGFSGFSSREFWLPHLEAVFTEVNVSRLDDFADRIEADIIGLAKVDVEGGELAVVQGAAKLLQSGRLRALQLEYGGTYESTNVTFLQVCEELAGYGYSLYRMCGKHRLAHIRRCRPDLDVYMYSNYLALAPDASDWSGVERYEEGGYSSGVEDQLVTTSATGCKLVSERQSVDITELPGALSECANKDCWNSNESYEWNVEVQQSLCERWGYCFSPDGTGPWCFKPPQKDE